MNYKVDLAARAGCDRDDAFAWYAENYSREFAARWYRGLTDAMRSLGVAPLRYGLAHENERFPFEVRELPVAVVRSIEFSLRFRTMS
jgi:hypothetical protein